jgi:ApbE superfamily uncharacterized protein (UPF0280 family)
MTAVAALLPDGRLHLQHGPIDCLCRAWGEPNEVRAAYRQAARFFTTVLEDLCTELPLLRTALPTQPPVGAIARAMHTACLPFADRFITPMAAVAGAVADNVLAAMVAGRDLTRAFVNNGGDIAFHLAPGTSLRCGLVTDLATAHIPTHTHPPLTPSSPPPSLSPPPPSPSWSGEVPAIRARTVPPPLHPPPQPTGQAPNQGTSRTSAHEHNGADRRTTPSPNGAPTQNLPTAPTLDGTFLLTADHPARGLATSGRACKGHGGRSFSFGIADSVSVLARTAAQADAAATIIANAVDLPGHSAIDRRPASAIDPASDLGHRLITFDVGPLDDAAIHRALDAGETMADMLLRNRLIDGAILTLRGHLRIPSPAVKEVA